MWLTHNLNILIANNKSPKKVDPSFKQPIASVSKYIGTSTILIILLKSLPIIIYFDNNLLSLLAPLFEFHTQTKLAQLPLL